MAERDRETLQMNEGEYSIIHQESHEKSTSADRQNNISLLATSRLTWRGTSARELLRSERLELVGFVSVVSRDPVPRFFDRERLKIQRNEKNGGSVLVWEEFTAPPEKSRDELISRTRKVAQPTFSGDAVRGDSGEPSRLLSDLDHGQSARLQYGVMVDTVDH
ncbi:hypothetical protein DFH09DRAFT_1101738 [Mycena vulgaris]|nr:hypothetical protein DFH09DRAFT_1101738 [Mycena vulgaris]